MSRIMERKAFVWRTPPHNQENSERGRRSLSARLKTFRPKRLATLIGIDDNNGHPRAWSPQWVTGSDIGTNDHYISTINHHRHSYEATKTCRFLPKYTSLQVLTMSNESMIWNLLWSLFWFVLRCVKNRPWANLLVIVLGLNQWHHKEIIIRSA